MWILMSLAMAEPAFDATSTCSVARITESLPGDGAVDVDPDQPLVLLFDDNGCGVWGEWVLESELGNADGFLEDFTFHGSAIYARLTLELEPLTAYQLTVYTEDEPFVVTFATGDPVDPEPDPEAPELSWDVLQVTRSQGRLIAFADVHTRAAPDHLVTIDSEGNPLAVDLADGTLRTFSTNFPVEVGEHCLSATTESRDGRRSAPIDACQLIEAPPLNDDETSGDAPYAPQGCGCQQGSAPIGLLGLLPLLLLGRRSRR